jgi:hypothetical protein
MKDQAKADFDDEFGGGVIHRSRRHREIVGGRAATFIIAADDLGR